MSDWMTIETAPKDGTEFLAYYPAEGGDDAFMDVQHWTVPETRESRYYGLMIAGVDPTHWMPLPEPPQTQ